MEKLNDTGFEISSPQNHDSFVGMTEKLNTLFNELCKENDTLRKFIRENGLENELRNYQNDLSDKKENSKEEHLENVIGAIKEEISYHKIISPEKITLEMGREQQTKSLERNEERVQDYLVSHFSYRELKHELNVRSGNITINDFEHEKYGHEERETPDSTGDEMYKGNFKKGDKVIWKERDNKYFLGTIENTKWNSNYIMRDDNKIDDVIRTQYLSIRFGNNELKEDVRYSYVLAANTVNIAKFPELPQTLGDSTLSEYSKENLEKAVSIYENRAIKGESGYGELVDMKHVQYNDGLNDYYHTSTEYFNAIKDAVTERMMSLGIEKASPANFDQLNNLDMVLKATHDERTVLECIDKDTHPDIIHAIGKWVDKGMTTEDIAKLSVEDIAKETYLTDLDEIDYFVKPFKEQMQIGGEVGDGTREVQPGDSGRDEKSEDGQSLRGLGKPEKQKSISEPQNEGRNTVKKGGR